MFEKEAEEICSKYFEENCYKKNKWADTHDLVAMWQDGYNKALEEATHNYNAIIADYDKQIVELAKANEWHYVKDGDLPKENKLYFVAIKDNGLAIAYFNGLHWETRYNLGDFGHCVETVIAWKEIVHPKED